MAYNAKLLAALIIIILLSLSFIIIYNHFPGQVETQTNNERKQPPATGEGTILGLSSIGKVYDDWNDIIKLIKSYGEKNPEAYYTYPTPRLLLERTVTAVVPLSAKEGAPTGQSFYRGNFQIESVLEGDIAAFNGTHISVITRGSLKIYKVVPPDEMILLRELKLEDIVRGTLPNASVTLTINGVSISYNLPFNVLDARTFLLSDRVVVAISISYYGIDFSLLEAENGTLFAPVKTIVAVYDQDLEQAGSLVVDGYMVDSRLINDTLEVVTSHIAYTVPVLDRVEVFIPTVNGEVVNPSRVVVVGNETTDYIIVSAINVTSLQYNTLTILSSFNHLTALLSKDSILYIALGSAPWMDKGESELYAVKISPVSIEVIGKTVLKGSIDSSWQLQPYKDYLIAITEPSWRTGEVNVYVLDKQDLSIAGKLEEIALDERVYGVRLIDDVLFLVTYRVVDPLFAINLTNPAKLSIIGYLKAPGFDTYFHPLSNGLLLGVGRSDDGSLRLSLYKFDGSKIKVLDRIEVGYAYSPVLSTESGGHRAFTYIPEKGLVIIPVMKWSSMKPYPIPMVFKINEENATISLVGELKHSDAVRFYYRDDTLYTIAAGFTPWYKIMTSEEGGEAPPTIVSWDLNTLTMISSTP